MGIRLNDKQGEAERGVRQLARSHMASEWLQRVPGPSPELPSVPSRPLLSWLKGTWRGTI